MDIGNQADADSERYTEHIEGRTSAWKSTVKGRDSWAAGEQVSCMTWKEWEIELIRTGNRYLPYLYTKLQC